MVWLDKEGESWEGRQEERKGGEAKGEGDMAGRLGGREQGGKELPSSKNTDRGNSQRRT